MLFAARAEASSPRRFRRCAETILTLSLLSVTCAQPPRSSAGGGATSAGAPASDFGAASSLGGQRGSSSGADGGATSDAGHPPRETEAEPEVAEPDVDDPDVSVPEDSEPVVDEPVVDEPVAPEPVPKDDGLPCDVKELLRTRCQSCHGTTPVGGALISLLDHADLTAPSKTLASVTVAARCLQRMSDSVAPMPPAPASHATSAEMAPIRAWLAAGLPRVTCEAEPSSPSSNPYDAPATCTSGSYWAANDTGAPWMMPGAPCIACHRQYFTRAPLFSVAGTVFATAHEPDKCHGIPLATGATIVITDANGKEHSPIVVASRGNFGAILSGLALPYRAKVVVGNRERVMLTPQSNGDCNACHTQAGSQGALGRLIVP